MRPDDGGGGGGPAVFTPPPGSPGGIHAAAAALAGQATSIGDMAQGVSRRAGLTVGSAHWQGEAQAAFTSTVSATSTVAGALEAPTNKLVRVVQAYADALDTAQKAIARAAAAYNTALTKANETADAVNANPNRTQADVDAADRTVAGYQADMTGAEADAGTAWARFRAARDKAVTDASDCCTGLGKGEEGSGFTGQLENLKSVNEQFRAAWDITPIGFAAEKQLSKLLESASSALPGLREGAADAKAAEEALKLRAAVLQVISDTGHASPANLAELADVTKSLDPAAEAVASGSRAATEVSALAKTLGVAKFGLGGTAIIGDVLTMISPADSGVMGTVDRVAAGTNAALVGTDLAITAGVFGAEAAIPVAGEVLMVGTGMYLAGDYLYHHWQPFHDAANWVGNETVSVVKDAGEVASDVGHTVSEGAKGAWDAVTSIF